MLKKTFLTGFIILLTISSFAQIYPEDSTVQAVGYWSVGETQSYWASLQQIKIKGGDTLSNQTIKYEIDITIVDSTAESYILEWHYKNYQVNSDSEFLRKIMSLADNVKVLIKTNEMGTLVGVENWEEVRDYMANTAQRMKEEMKNIPNIDEIVKQVETTYSSKQAIEAGSILDAHQYYSFHGGAYKLNETYEGQIQVPFLYSNTPLDADVIAYVDEIFEEDNNYIVRSSQTINPQQLTEASFQYLVKMASDAGAQAPIKDEISELSNQIDTAARIHGSGWVIYSIQTKTVSAEDVVNIEERILEIK